MTVKKVGIIGSGLGGCTLAALLSKEGYKVKIFEKNKTPGGRCQSFTLGSGKDLFRFDVGASMILMLDTFQELSDILDGEFEISDLGLKKCSPSSVVHVLKESDKSCKSKSFFDWIHPTKSLKSSQVDGSDNINESIIIPISEKYLSNLEKNGKISKRVKTFLEEGKIFYKAAKQAALKMSYQSVFELFSSRTLSEVNSMAKACKRTGVTSLYKYCELTFENEAVAKALSLQSMYMGLSPFDALSFYSFLTVDELLHGIYYPCSKSGMSILPMTMLNIVKKYGGKIVFEAEVESIYSYNKEKIVSPTIKYKDINGVHKQEVFDIIVSNADLCYTYKRLLKDKATTAVLDKMGYGCSTISFHWAIAKKLVFSSAKNQSVVHRVFLGKEFKHSFKEIFNLRCIPSDLSFYIHIPSNIDDSAAPKNMSAMTVLVPVGCENITRTQVIDVKFEILKRLQREGSNLKLSDILHEKIYTPKTWRNAFSLHKGCALGLNHDPFQLGPFRPSNQDRTRPWLYFVGANTQPGCGVPTVIHSAMNVFKTILRRDSDHGPTLSEITSMISQIHRTVDWKLSQKLFRYLEKIGIKASSSY